MHETIVQMGTQRTWKNMNSGKKRTWIREENFTWNRRPDRDVSGKKEPEFRKRRSRPDRHVSGRWVCAQRAGGVRALPWLTSTHQACSGWRRPQLSEIYYEILWRSALPICYHSPGRPQNAAFQVENKHLECSILWASSMQCVCRGYASIVALGFAWNRISPRMLS